MVITDRVLFVWQEIMAMEMFRKYKLQVQVAAEAPPEFVHPKHSGASRSRFLQAHLHWW
jgi:hypothetical protein